MKLKSLLFTGTALLLFFSISLSCQSESTDNASNNSVENAEHETPPIIDSAQAYILDSNIYAVMNFFFDELEGGSDSNIIHLEAIVPEFNYLNYFYDEPSELDLLILTRGEGKRYFNATTKDSVHIRKQLKENEGKHWITENFRGIAYDSLMLATYSSDEGFNWDEFKKDGFGCFESYSIPVFNADSSNCIIQIHSYCHNLLASGSSYFLEKHEGIWKIVGRKNDWMS